MLTDFYALHVNKEVSSTNGIQKKMVYLKQHQVCKPGSQDPNVAKRTASKLLCFSDSVKPAESLTFEAAIFQRGVETPSIKLLTWSL